MTAGAGRKALVLGGSGTVGREVVALLARAGASVRFTYRTGRDVADTLHREHGAEGVEVDLRQPKAIDELFEGLVTAGHVPDLMVACAAVTGPASLEETPAAVLEEVTRVNATSAVAAARALAAHLPEGTAGDVVFVGALAGTQSLPLPPAFAASQGLLSSSAMALAKALGGRDIRVNMVAVGVLERGLSDALSPQLVTDFERYSALKRRGRPEEAARAICWLALHNTYVNGKVLAANGGL